MKLFFKTYWTYFVSFIIPVLIMAGVYLSQGIYWNSVISPLLGDGFHQYVIFDVTLRNIIHGNGSLFYTFTSGL
ncbi:YfhO family protein, partial [Streptococcus mitis]|uniref:YfhO family protein n=1 Tax=Streptococcus mitis TaxID=28037 RepID=UPI0039EF6834